MRAAVPFKAVVVLLVVVMLLLNATAQETPTPKEAVSNVTLSTFRRTPLLLDFPKLIPNFPGMVVRITQLPANGVLRSATTGRVITSDDTTQDNRFTYTPNAGFPADGIRAGRDVVGFDVLLQGTAGSAFVNINVVLRRLIVRNYTLYAVTNSQGRVVSLNARDQQGNVLTQRSKLTEVRVETLPDNGCTLQQFNGDAITAPQTAVSDSKLRLVMFPRLDMQESESCSFTFTAQRSNGFRTRPRVVNMIRRSPFVPRSFSTSSVYTVDAEVSRMVELIGSTQNPDTNLTFVITSLPKVGQLFDVAETSQEELPSVGISPSQIPYAVPVGGKTRLVLFYKTSPAEVQNVNSVSFDYQVRDTYKTSKTSTVTIKLFQKQSPVCGNVVVSPVFWDRPAKELVLNYSNPSGRQIQKIVLLSGPKDPIGDLYYERSTLTRGTQKVTVAPGDYFSDKNKRLSYLVRKDRMRVSGNETYVFRVQALTGMSCVGTITFVVMQHDAQSGANVRREIVRVGSINLLPLWGTANRTVMNPTHAVISSLPAYGSLFSVSELLPWEKGLMYRVNRRGQARPYCVRHDCQPYLDTRLDSGSKLKKVTLTDESTLDQQNRFWIFYQAPGSLQPLSVKDSFEYYFVNANGERSETQRVDVSFRKRKKRIITCVYKSQPPNVDSDFDKQTETYIKCVLSNATAAQQAVMIPEFDKYRRHGAQVPFRLFQFRDDGNRVIAGERLSNSTYGDVVGMWLDRENTVIVVPTARTRQQVFQFRAVIFNKTSSGDLIKSTREEVRVVVKRENTVPEWDREFTTGRGTVSGNAGEVLDIDVYATDADGDLLQFRLAETVKKGTLWFEDLRFGVNSLSVVKRGAILRPAKGSIYRSSVRLHYKADAGKGWSFPQQDTFTLYADDGGGVLSDPLTFNITLVGDVGEHRSNQATSTSSSFATIAAVLVVAVVGLLFLIAAIFRRKSRQRYMSVPQDIEMQN